MQGHKHMRTAPAEYILPDISVKHIALVCVCTHTESLKCGKTLLRLAYTAEDAGTALDVLTEVYCENNESLQQKPVEKMVHLFKFEVALLTH